MFSIKCFQIRHAWFLDCFRARSTIIFGERGLLVAFEIVHGRVVEKHTESLLYSDPNVRTSATTRGRLRSSAQGKLSNFGLRVEVQDRVQLGRHGVLAGRCVLVRGRVPASNAWLKNGREVSLSSREFLVVHLIVDYGHAGFDQFVDVELEGCL